MSRIDTQNEDVNSILGLPWCGVGKYEEATVPIVVNIDRAPDKMELYLHAKNKALLLKYLTSLSYSIHDFRLSGCQPSPPH